MSSERENIINELQKLAPELNRMEKKNPFIVPDGYFAKLPNEIQERKKQSSGVQFAYSDFISSVRVAFAAVVIIIFVVVGIHFLQKPSDDLLAGDDFIFDEHLAWYAEYDHLNYYEIISETDFEARNVIIADEHIIDYFSDYSAYYQHEVIDIIED